MSRSFDLFHTSSCRSIRSLTVHSPYQPYHDYCRLTTRRWRWFSILDHYYNIVSHPFLSPWLIGRGLETGRTNKSRWAWQNPPRPECLQWTYLLSGERLQYAPADFDWIRWSWIRLHILFQSESEYYQHCIICILRQSDRCNAKGVAGKAAAEGTV